MRLAEESVRQCHRPAGVFMFFLVSFVKSLCPLWLNLFTTKETQSSQRKRSFYDVARYTSHPRLVCGLAKNPVTAPALPTVKFVVE
jgi:hypothetical protein